MTTKLSPGLERRLEEADADDGVPVIVTYRAGADVSALERRGLQVRRRYQHIPSVAGTLRAGDARDLAALDEVERIEVDEDGVHAL